MADLHHFITIYDENLSDTVLDVCGVQVRAMHSFYNDANSIKDAAIDPAILDHGFENIFYAYNPKKPHQNIPKSGQKNFCNVVQNVNFFYTNLKQLWKSKNC